MKSGVVYYILLLLDVNDTVTIPNVGKLNKRVYPAKSDLDKREIHPPHASIHFDGSTVSNDGLLSKFITHSTGLSEDEANVHLRNFSEEVVAELKSKGRVAIDHLGIFYQRDEEILFVPDSKTSNLGYAGLKTVSMPAVPARPEAKATPTADEVEARSAVAVAVAVEHEVPERSEQPEEPTTKSEPERREPIDRRLIWLVGLFAMIFLVVAAIAILNYTTKEDSQYPSSAFNRAPMTDPMVSPTSDDTMPDTNSAEPFPGEDTITHFGVPLSKDAPKSSDQPQVIERKESKDQPSLNNETPPAQMNEEEPIKDISPISKKTPAPKISGDDSLPGSTTATTTRQCHVVVGAFGVDSNVRRMVSRLESMGYDVDTMSRGPLTQVGVPAPCGTAEIERVLGELRMSVESKAWILNK